MFFHMVWGTILIFLFGVGCISAGFKLLKDSKDPTYPGQLRPTPAHAIGLWVIGGLALLFVLF